MFDQEGKQEGGKGEKRSEGTITPKLLERTAPGLMEERRTRTGALPAAAEMGREIALTAMNTDIPTGATVVVGEALHALLAKE